MEDPARTTLVVVAGLVGLCVLFMCLVVGVFVVFGFAGLSAFNSFPDIYIPLSTRTP